MKRLTCEMCGSTDLIKQGGVFVCQSCGIKYSVEEAKKMLESTVDETVLRVSVDTSERLEKILVLARRARAENNTEEAKKYYELALLEAPDDWEASFYSLYYKLLESPVGKLSESLSNFVNRVRTSLQIILSDNEDDAVPEKIADLFGSISRVYLIITDYVEDKDQEFTNAMSDLEISWERFDNMANKLVELDRIIDTMRTSILDAYRSLESHAVVDQNIVALRNLLYVCSTLYCFDAKRIFWIRNYKQFTCDLLDFEKIMVRQTPGYDGQAYKALKAKAIAINDANNGANNGEFDPEKGYQILELLRQEERVFYQEIAQKYWAEHQDEHKKLKAELQRLQSETEHLNTQLAELRREKNALSAVTELATIREQISSLTKQKNSLGFFKRKEKKVLQDRISTAELQAEKVQQVLDSQQHDVDEKIAAVDDRLSYVQMQIVTLNNRLENPTGSNH